MFLWWHEDTSSLFLLSDDNSCWKMISNFSLRQRLHLLLAPLWGDVEERMHHEINWTMLISLGVQIYRALLLHVDTVLRENNLLYIYIYIYIYIYTF